MGESIFTGIFLTLVYSVLVMLALYVFALIIASLMQK